jgi:hypothetical protein
MFETEIVTPKSGSTVLCWDSMFERDKNPDDKISCHGEVGMVIDKADATDLDSTGAPLGMRANNCFLVMFPNKVSPMVVHSAWLRVVEAEA